nr:cytochrome P450 4c21-like [Aedes albopictus]
MLLIAIFITLLIVLLFIKFIEPLIQLRNVPSVRPWYPLVGNVFLFLGKTGEQLFVMMNSVFARHDRLFLLWFGIRPVVGVCHPDLIRKVLTSGACLEKPFFYRFSRTDQGLWAAKTSLWRHQRKALNATFSPSVLKNFVPIFEAFSKQLVQDLSQHDGCPIDLLPITLACTLRMIGNTTMGVDASDESDIVKFVSNMDRITEIVSKRFLSVHLHSEQIYRMTPSYTMEIEMRQQCSDYTMKILDKRKRKINSEQTALHKVFIDQLLEESTIGRPFSDTEIVHNVYTMLTAGSETTGRSVAYACLLLAVYPDIQEKVYNEIMEKYSDCTQPLTIDTLAELTYLDAFLKECHRLYPVAPYIARESTDSLELDGVTFPKGSVFVFNFFVLHRNDAIWGSESERFHPERFLDERYPERSMFGYLPFSGGQRNCIGQRYATISLKVMLVHLVRNFKIETPLRYQDLQFKFGMMLELSTECLVRFSKRGPS